MENLSLKETSSEAFQMLTFKEQMDLSPEHLEENFAFEKLSEESKESAVRYHFAMLNNPEAFIGAGNNALVFQGKEIENVCVKCRWEPVPMVNNKSKKYNRLPDNLQGLRKVQSYFELINRKKAAMAGRGAEFIPQRKSLHEALLTKKAHDILIEAGMKDSSPEIQFVIKIEYEESGMCAENDPYQANETVYLLYMTKIHGKNLEEIIREGSEDIASKIDAPAFLEKLKAIVTTLHKNGMTHNDMSLRNVMLDEKTFEPRLIDFGTAQYEPDRPMPENLAHDDISYVENNISKWLTKFTSNPKTAAAELISKQEKTIDKF